MEDIENIITKLSYVQLKSLAAVLGCSGCGKKEVVKGRVAVKIDEMRKQRRGNIMDAFRKIYPPISLGSSNQNEDSTSNESIIDGDTNGCTDKGEKENQSGAERYADNTDAVNEHESEGEAERVNDNVLDAVRDTVANAAPANESRQSTRENVDKVKDITERRVSASGMSIRSVRSVSSRLSAASEALRESAIVERELEKLEGERLKEIAVVEDELDEREVERKWRAAKEELERKRARRKLENLEQKWRLRKAEVKVAVVDKLEEFGVDEYEQRNEQSSAIRRKENVVDITNSEAKVPLSTVTRHIEDWSLDEGDQYSRYELPLKSRAPHSKIDEHIRRDHTSRAEKICSSRNAEVAGDRRNRDSDNVGLAQLTMRAKLPSIEPDVFKGDPSRYPLFKSQLRMLYEGTGMTSEEKMGYLSKYVRGNVSELVEACMYLPEDERFEAAMTLLDEEYGENDIVCNGYLEELLSFPNISKGTSGELKRYHVQLLKTFNALRGRMDGTSKLDDVTIIVKLVAKLPSGLRDKWRRKVQEMKVRDVRLKFCSLLEFVGKSAKEVSDPIFNEECLRRAREGLPLVGTVKESVKQRVLAVRESIDCKTEARMCIECKGAHWLPDCEIFKAMDVRERRDKIFRKKLCYGCLQSDHLVRDCKEVCTKCSGRHHELLHGMWQTNKPNENDWRRNRGNKSSHRIRPESEYQRDRTRNWNMKSFNSVDRNAVRCTQGKGRGGKMTVVSVRACTFGKSVSAGACLDPGSAVSFVTSDLAKELGGSCDVGHKLEVVTIDGEATLTCKMLHGVIVVGEECQEEIRLPPLYVVDELPGEACDPSGVGFQQCDYLSHIQIGRQRRVRLLLGLNAPAVLEPMEVVSAPKAGMPFAWKSRLGWLICMGGECENEKVTVNRIAVKEGKELAQQFKRVFEVGFENACDEEKGLSIEDKKWMKIVNEGCEKVNGRYEIPLPFKREDVCMSPSRNVAFKRAVALRKKLNEDPEQKEQYTRNIREMVNEGYCEQAKRAVVNDRKAWFIPHFGVRQRDKIRVVFDCAARSGGMCLNDVLLQGPDVNNLLWDVLMKFREGSVAYMADVKAMFYQVRVPERQREYMRFWWWSNDELEGEPVEFEMNVHVFGAVCSPSVAVYALRRAADDCVWCDREVRSVVKEHFYVDDCLRACDSVNEARRELNEVMMVCQEGGFKLHKFVSNNENVVPLESREVSKALGVKWNLRDDCLGVRRDQLKDPKPLSKRGLLARIAVVFDPLGIVGPLILRGRLIFQETVCETSGGDWDSSLSDDVLVKLQKWEDDLKRIDEVGVVRNAFPCGCELQLHVFSDASNFGHSAVAYCRVNGENITLNFISGKCKVNSLKAVSIPRLELVAAVLSVKVRMWIERCVKRKFERVVMWTDSMAVLGYIRNDRERYKVFEANRLQFVRDNSSVKEWRFVNSELNPADDGSRGILSQRWLKGPLFLYEEESEWPEEPGEVSSVPVTQVNTLAVNYSTEADKFAAEFIEGASNWHTLRRRLVWWWRLCEWRRSGQKRGAVSVSELKKAERALVSYVQRQEFGKDVLNLERNGVVHRTSRLASLSPCLNDGLVCVYGRLRKADSSKIETELWLLPSKGHLVTLIIRWYHELAGHMGVWAVLSMLRERFWVIAGVSTVRGVIGKCVVCRKEKSRACKQRMADLPVERVNRGMKAFEVVGVDCFGPFEIKTGRGRSRIKRWAVIFTCLAIRAVHLEVLYDMSASCMLNAISRFIARRGRVTKFVSDQGTNLIGARKELAKCLGEHQVSEGMKARGIQWIFNPPGASHYGGVWERMIGVVRRVIGCVWGKHVFTDETFATSLCEAEGIINGRPLTLVSSDVADLPPLSPNSLLILDGVYQHLGEEAESLHLGMKAWKQVQALADAFWNRWAKEYLNMLRERQKWKGVNENVRVGDIVLVIDANLPRGHWPMGRVITVTQSEDGLVRRVTVRMGNKEYDRPITKLIRLLENS